LDTCAIFPHAAHEIDMDNDPLPTLMGLSHKRDELEGITLQNEQEQGMGIERHLHIFARFNGRCYRIEMGKT
jgi:hypothetical protein